MTAMAHAIRGLCEKCFVTYVSTTLSLFLLACFRRLCDSHRLYHGATLR